MLSLLFRRITLTGLLLTAFVGTGMLFGSADRAAASAGMTAGIELPDNLPEKAVNVAENPDMSTSSGPVRKGLDLGWPFFSFSRKGGR